MDSETQQAFKDSAKDLISRGVPARRRTLMLTGDGAVDRVVWRQMAEAGWTSVLISEDDGGLGLGLAEVVAIAEEAGVAALPEPFIASAIHVGVVLSAARESAMAQELMRELIAGDLIAGVAWQDEPGQLEPIDGTRLHYQRSAEGVVLEGERHFVTPVAGVDGWLVLASGEAGPALIWIRADVPGITANGAPGVGGVPAGSLSLNRIRVASEQVLLFGEAAVAAVACANDVARIAQGAELVGVARAALTTTIDYMNTRVQFGKPIGSFQALQHRLVDAYIQVELAAAAVRDATHVDLDSIRQRAAAASRAKARCAQAALLVTRLAVQLHGAIGYTEEGPIGTYLHRAITLAALLGNESAHRRRYFANQPAMARDAHDEKDRLRQTVFPRDADWEAMSDEAFRQMLRDFFATYYPKELRHAPRRLHWREIGGWYRTLAAQGWIAPAWPKAFGGMALPPDKLIAYIEEQEFYGVGRPPDQGLIMLGPILFRFGTVAQRERFLPKILSGEHVWAQGYSEPNAGSDLASLRTQATLDGDVFIVSGQKTWSTLAQDATHMFMLVRTDNSGKKQHGITFLLVDLKSPGVTVRPIRTIAGDEEFCEVFFDDVRVPVENLVGEIHKGWDIAKQLLGFERIFSGSPKHSQYTLGQVRELAESRGLLADPVWADRYAQAMLDVADLGSAYAGFAEMVKRGDTLPAEVSYLKIWATETHERVAMLLNDMAAESAMQRGAVDAGGKPVHVHMPLYSALAAKIFSGSNEIQRNILAKQVLGLPT
ncbi:acyl-CoA dehydrogenase domain-containing protein [Caballeronia choica]|jgi:3-oxochol-4-en-24-oyl-CoA dehydrogenase|uniref:Acyl-CoA dehydrogenase domain-containing protein n=1 Tax=Caballeronia choica TaxID=326476 RepID=A0A158K552_9BURK|nr:acyl-CoA dehydrogenase family protein [Caballeronia choica]SAL76284.1 acyl-CoA dehydrogenase domain-containing protein [Caballeronia choica]